MTRLALACLAVLSLHLGFQVYDLAAIAQASAQARPAVLSCDIEPHVVETAR